MSPTSLPTRPRTWLEHNTYGLLAIAGWFAVFILIAVLIPDDISAPVLPLESIEGYARLSAFPDKTRVVLSLMWICVPVVAALTYHPVRRMLNVEWLHAHRLAGAAIVIAIVGTAVLVAFNVPDAADLADRGLMARTSRRMSRSALGLGFVSAAWSLALGFGLAVAAATLREFFNRRITDKGPRRLQ